MLKGPMFYEGLLRVGFLIKGPGISAGKVVGDPISNTDVAATLLDYAGVESFYSMHGRSVRPMVESSSTSRDYAYGEWDLNPEHWGLDLKLRVVRTKRYKMTVEVNSGAGELYDLADDHAETVNRFESDRVVRKELEEMLNERPPDELKDPLTPSGVH